MADLLLELFSEEIPARMQANAVAWFEKSLETALKDARLECEAIQRFVTPRRVALLVTGLPESQPDLSVERKGPKVGAPEQAMAGFLKSTGLSIDQLEKRTKGNDEFYFAVIDEKGKPAAQALKPILEAMIADYTWPKSMRWGAYDSQWVRPLHSILCIFDGDVIPVSFGPITASNITYGHRFLNPEAIEISDASSYESTLKSHHVIVSPEARAAIITDGIEKLAAKEGLHLKQDEGLLAEVVGLVEWPVVLMGSIDTNFMGLPPEVLTSEMRHHQKYFALLDKDEALASRFIIVSNMITDDGGKAVVHGNERVLRARLADGAFFWDQDRKQSLAEWAKQLDGVIFHAKLGSVADKISRIQQIAAYLNQHIPGANQVDVVRAAELCKADLVTGMVGEFPDLQGVMGRYYALEQNEQPHVADAIRDHYLPQGETSPCPSEATAILLSLADKIDTLVGMFAIDEKPTGSKDPFALRRAAIGIIRVILENALQFNLRELLAFVHALHVEKKPNPKLDDAMDIYHDEVHVLLDFFCERLKVILKKQGVRHDFIDAIFDGGNEDNLFRLMARVKELEKFIASEDGINLLAAQKRARNIIFKEAKKDNISPAEFLSKPDASKFSKAEERDLYEKISALGESLQHLMQEDQFSEIMKMLATLRASVDAYFDHVTVNADDAAVRKNRLHTLAQIDALFSQVANFSLIEG